MNNRYLVKAAGVFFLVLWFSCFGSKAQGPPLPPDPYFLLDSWSFPDTNWYSDLGDAPISFTNLNNPPSFDGNALQVDSTNVAFLQYNIVDDVATNLTFSEGTIELWILPDWNSGAGPGDWGRLVDVGAYGTNNPSSWWSLYFSPDGNNICFSSETNGVFTNYLSYPISWDTNTWHLIDLTYMPFRSMLYIDGQLATNGDGARYSPSPETVSNGLYVGSDITGWQQSRALIDDLVTYNYALDPSDVSNDYTAGMQIMNGGGFGPDDEPPLPEGGEGGTNGDGGGYFPGVPLPDYGTNLYLTITNAFNGQASGWINNSSIFVPYTIFSRQSLPWPIWSPEATFYGSWQTNLTAFSVPILARSNLFLEARSEIAPRIVGGGNSQFGALRRDGTVWTWGDGDSGQLGNGQWTNSDAPVQASGLSNVVAIAVPSAGDYDLALDANGKVWSWGNNGYGQLGRHDELYLNTNIPVVIPGLSNIVAIAGGSGHAIALRSDGTVWAWGDNTYGDLGNGTNTQRDYAAPVLGLTNAIAIASGDFHCFALCSDGRVWGWGLNEVDELGIGNENDQATPILISGLTNAVALAGGYYHSIALLSNGTIRAWGDNLFGEIGDISSSTPVPVPGLSNIVSIACGQIHNLFIDKNGNLFAWGNDADGQFGDGGTDDGNTAPYLLTTVSNVTAIAGGAESSIISTGNGNIYTFGDSYEYESDPTLTDLYTNYSSDGSGLPDWWELMYFHHLGLNPSADPVGDGWTLLQDYEQGLNPTNFITPPAITGVTVTQTNVMGDIILTWNAETPTPLNYAIYRIDYNYTNWQYGTAQEIGEVASNVTTFTDTGSVPGGDDNSIYEVDGIYGGGTSPFSAESYVNSELPGTLSDNLPFTAALTRNETGRWQIMFSGLPQGLHTIQLSWRSNSGSTTQDISVSNLVNGVYSISDSAVVNDLGTTLYAQGVGPDSLLGQQIYVGYLPDDAPYFVNGSQHLKQNLSFVIRGASLNTPWANFFNLYNDGSDNPYRMNQFGTDFEEFSFLHHDWQFTPDSSLGEYYGEYFVLDNLWPFTANYYLENFILDTSRTNINQSPEGVTNFNFTINFATNVPAPPILTHADPYWVMQPGFFADQYYPDYINTTNWGVTVTSTQTVATLESGIDNLFNLPFETGCIVFAEDADGGEISLCEYAPIDPGDSIASDAPSNHLVSTYGSWCPAPALQFTNYYLAPLDNIAGNTFSLPTNTPSPLPIDDSFAVTNQTPAVMFGAVGQPMIIGAWAKYLIQGSSPTKYAYLGQYFTTNAYEVNDSGNITTTNTGIVSPYGEFFPTEPGPVALITMTNADSGTQATGIVNVISLALDANHDGTIDPTWNGPDFTSPSRPYVFWLNNNYDRTNWDVDDQTFYDEDVESNSPSAVSPFTGQSAPDYEYRDSYGNRVIPTPRDLEDFARLWICGLTSNLVSTLPANSTVTLSWGDVGNPNPNNPTIDLFTAGDADGGMEYLTNSESSDDQIDPIHAPYVGRLAPGGRIQLNGFQFNGWAGNYFIWCGVTNGTGALTLTITDPNSNILAQTSAYIQLEDIKQMFERWTVGDNSSVPPLTSAVLATDSLPQGALSPFRYTNPGSTNTTYILFVHGWNCSPFDKDWFAQTAFKRLYWQGYQGRFGEFRWPTYYGFLGTLDQLFTNTVDKDDYDDGEYQAWQSAQGLLNKLEDLDDQYPGQVYVLAHSMGNVVAGEALRLAGTNQVVNTYVASQAAVTAHTYDPTIADYSFVYLPWSFEASTPNIYGDWFAGNYGNGAGRIISLYNTNDFALSRSHWQLDQLFKPDQDVSENSTNWFYGYDGTVSDPAPWNNFYKHTLTSDAYINFDIVTNLNNRYEVMAFAAEPYTTAFGATPGVHNISASADLTTIWPSPDPLFSDYGAHFYHSAEFRGDPAWQWNYWNTVLYSEEYGFKISSP
jgi:alpha-tubulin suppressor-like RCC1 family protein